MATKKNNNRWSQSKFAKVFRRDPAVISRLVGRGILTPGATWIEWARELLDHYAEAAAGRSSEVLNLADERAKLARAQAMKINYELAKDRGQFVNMSAAAVGLSYCASVVKSKLLSLPSRIKAANPDVSVKAFISIDEAVRECLTEIGRSKLPEAVRAEMAKIDEAKFQELAEQAGREAEASRDSDRDGQGAATPKTAQPAKTSRARKRHKNTQQNLARSRSWVQSKAG